MSDSIGAPGPPVVESSMPSVLVTGAAGFMGSHVVDACLELGMAVVSVDDLSGGYVENVPQASTWVQGDLGDPDFVQGLWDDHGPFQYVYHLAAYAAEGLSHFIRNYNYRNNLLVSVNVVNECVKHETECLIFTSSIAVYGAGQLPMTEELTPQPEDPYGIAKYAVELDVRAAHEMFGLNYVIFRPHNVYGTRQNIADTYRNVVGIFMNQTLKGEPMTIFGDGTQTRAFSNIIDVAPLIAKSPLVQGARQHTFNVGADTPVSVAELASEVAAAFDMPCAVRHLDPRKEVVHAFADHTKLKRTFCPPAPIDLRTGVREMATWVRARGPAVPVTYENIEIMRNLPPSWHP